jgi:hypothetical protein
VFYRRNLKNLKVSNRISALVWDCHQSLITLSERNNVHFLWVPDVKEIEGNEIADQLAKGGSLHPFIGPELACGTSDRVTGRVISAKNTIVYSRTKACKELSF